MGFDPDSDAVPDADLDPDGGVDSDGGFVQDCFVVTDGEFVVFPDEVFPNGDPDA